MFLHHIHTGRISGGILTNYNTERHDMQHVAFSSSCLQVFNPFTCSDCPEHSDEHEEYVAGEDGLLWQGLSDDYTASWIPFWCCCLWNDRLQSGFCVFVLPRNRQTCHGRWCYPPTSRPMFGTMTHFGLQISWCSAWKTEKLEKD